MPALRIEPSRNPTPQTAPKKSPTGGGTVGRGGGAPPSAAYRFSANQKQFITAMAAASGLNQGVIAAWVAAENPVGADQTSNKGDQNWLNIGVTSANSPANYLRGARLWRDPATAGKTSADWLAGKPVVPGWRNPPASIRAIAKAGSLTPDKQLDVIKNSGWAESGYPLLASTYDTYGKPYADMTDGKSDSIIPGFVKDAANGVADVVSAPVKLAKAAYEFLHLLTQSDTWFRIGKVVLGLTLAIFAIIKLADSSPTIKAAAAVAA